MIGPSGAVRVLVATKPVDFRKGADGLAALVKDQTPRVMSLAPDEFIRRFLIHSLPDGFHRIRHYGFLANGCRRTRLATIRRLLPSSDAGRSKDAVVATTRKRPLFDPTICPCCAGAMRIISALPRLLRTKTQLGPDTS